jgi:ribose 5-phosphate isomerase B
METVVFGSDHAGYQYKRMLLSLVSSKGYNVVDVGCDSSEPADFPVYAKLACEEIINKRAHLGVLVCGSGIGISIAANRFNGIRCAVCHDYFTAVNSRLKDNANIIAIGERTTGAETAKQMVEAFLETQFNNTNPDYVRRTQLVDNINN